MADMTVQQLASLVGLNVEVVMQRLKEAGLEKGSPTDIVTDEQKAILLKHMQTQQQAPKKITLSLKKKAGDAKGPAMVEIRKKRTFTLPSADDLKKMVEQEEAERLEDVQRAETLKKQKTQPEKSIDDKALTSKTDQDSKTLSKKKKEIQLPEPVGPVLVREGVDKERGHKDKHPREEEDEIESRAKKQKARLEDRGTRHFSLAALEDDEEEEKQQQLLNVRRKKKHNKSNFIKPTEPMVHTVSIPSEISVSDLAEAMAVKATEVIKTLMNMGITATINQNIDQDTAMLVVEEMGHKPIAFNENALEESLLAPPVGTEVPRPPVVTIMGHVDHGKTSLLDYIRRTKVAQGEAGGITQHIGAYHVETPKGGITFLDTPGHAAFTAMRARGAQVTDIVILVIAADDGVMPQTVEAIEHAKAAKVPLIVALTKIDKPEANIERIKQALTTYEIVPEEWGGETMFVGVSSKTGEGVDALLEAILLQAEVLELKAVPEAPARGVILEARLDKGRGIVASMLVQNGTLKRSDVIVAGTSFGRARALFDERGQQVSTAGPSIPVEVLGLADLPAAGDLVFVTDEKQARSITALRLDKLKAQMSTQATSLENAFERLKQSNQQGLNLILKADVHGSLEALRAALEKLGTDEIRAHVISSGIGAITESDVSLAKASGAVLLGFNVRADSAARKLAERDKLEIRYYNIIYNLLDDVKKAMQGLLSPERHEKITGIAEVREVFKSSKFGTIAGCMVTEGVIKRNNPIRVLRDNVVIFEGTLESLRRFKEDAGEVRQGMECGIGVKNYNDVRVGDQIEVYEVTETQRVL